jgi:Rrf2 family protein
MQITKQADYALRAVLYLSRLEEGGRASTRDIANTQHIPPSFLAKIVSQLSIAGLIQTARGARGGVTLGKPAEQISILEVIEAIDGPMLLNECTGNPRICPFEGKCPLHVTWCEMRKLMHDKLSHATFARENVMPVG